MRFFLQLILCFLPMFLSGDSEVPSRSFASCPDTPNCVSSLVQDSKHFIDPIAYQGQEHPFKILLKIIQKLPRSQIQSQEDNYIHLTVRSRIFSFIDDLEFLYDPKASLIHMRSASRSGYYDFGVNRKRLEKIRKEFLSLSKI